MGQTQKARRSGLTVWTIGHSTRTIAEFIGVLRAHEIELVADVRRFPGSRRLPHFGSSELERSLNDSGIALLWIPYLGGRRSPLRDSPNTGWRVDGFRGYADYIGTEEFAEGLFQLTMAASGMRTAIMCAEILWWQCHRRLISDVLTWSGASVLHIRDELAAERHELALPARVVDGRLTYASDTQLTLI